MSTILLALGLVFVIEGLALALAPSRIREVLRLLSEMPASTRRGLGLAAMTCGVLLIWVAKSLGA